MVGDGTIQTHCSLDRLCSLDRFCTTEKKKKHVSLGSKSRETMRIVWTKAGLVLPRLGTPCCNDDMCSAWGAFRHVKVGTT